LGEKLKVVLDTNVWISIALSKTLADEFLPLIRRKKIEPYISKFLAEEIATVLAYPRIATALEQAGIEPLAALSNILGLATLVKTRRPARVIEEDPADNRVLECALRAKAIFIVSGDKHVLKLGEFKGIRILSPREFLNEPRGTRS